jgi:hypothetical protein
MNYYYNDYCDTIASCQTRLGQNNLSLLHSVSPMPQEVLMDMEESDELIPCENFSLVCKGVYRSSFPKKKNFAFLKRLQLKSVLYIIKLIIRTLILEDYPEQNQKFLELNGIKLFQFGVAGNKVFLIMIHWSGTFC